MTGLEPTGLSPALAALWRDARGDWEGAHQLAVDHGGGAGDWVHAYLHRKKGDDGNAAYWYARAHRDFPYLSFDDEWVFIVGTLLKAPP